ncbi:MAG: hypothetical protein ABJA82_15090 [Myxococcales bacterium]
MRGTPNGILMNAGAATLDGPWQLSVWSRKNTRTGGPDDEDDEAALVRKLMPIVAILIMLAVIFG